MITKIIRIELRFSWPWFSSSVLIYFAAHVASESMITSTVDIEAVDNFALYPPRYSILLSQYFFEVLRYSAMQSALLNPF